MMVMVAANYSRALQYSSDSIPLQMTSVLFFENRLGDQLDSRAILRGSRRWVSRARLWCAKWGSCDPASAPTLIHIYIYTLDCMLYIDLTHQTVEARRWHKGHSGRIVPVYCIYVYTVVCLTD